MRNLCIDVSHWDSDVDFGAWREMHGLWGVIVKAGGNERGMGRYEDPMYAAHYDRAREAGLHVGSYYYTVSTTIEDAVEDARHFASLLSGRQFDLPVYMDVEDPAQFELSPRALTDVIKAFCDELGRLGFKAGLYTGGSAWLNSMHSDELLQYADWIAWWRESWPTEAGDIGMWQQGTMRLSDGAVFYDDVSGCTDLDWCRIDYPARIVGAGLNGYGGGESPRGEATVGLTIAERIAQTAEHIAEHDAHGYSQPNRAGDGVETITYSDGSTAQIHGDDYDCSEMARMCAAAAGALPWDYWDSYMWTGNAHDVLTGNNFECLDFDWYDVRRGDLLWVSGHMGIALGDGLQADAHGDEYGGIDGPNTGDQTGAEIEIRDLKWYWTQTFRYVGPEPFLHPEPVVVQLPGEPVNDAGLWYRAHVEGDGWLDPVHDGQAAGTEGFAKRLEAIKITPPEGWELWVRVHVQDYGWVTYEGIRRGESSGEGTSDNDPIIGTVGENRRIEDIIIGVSKRPDGDTRKLRFCVHQQNVGWKAWTEEGNASGTDGMSIRLEAIRIAIW